MGRAKNKKTPTYLIAQEAVGQQQQTDSCDYDEAPQGDEYDEWMMGK